jgi:transposase
MALTSYGLRWTDGHESEDFDAHRSSSRIDGNETELYVVASRAHCSKTWQSSSSCRRRSPTYYVYVIELSRKCTTKPCALAPLYVEQTAHTPEHRFAQHKAGAKLAAGKPYRFGVRLRYDLMKVGIDPIWVDTIRKADTMSRMPDTKRRRPPRQFDEELRTRAVRLVLDEGKTVGAVARDLDLTPSALRLWVTRTRADRTHGRTGLIAVEREELARLRKGSARAAHGARHPKKAAAFFAKHQS